jgi:hypothetical protein
MKFPNLDHLITGHWGLDHPDNMAPEPPDFDYKDYLVCHRVRHITFFQVKRKLCPICGVDLFNAPVDECGACRTWFDDTLDALRSDVRTSRHETVFAIRPRGRRS